MARVAPGTQTRDVLASETGRPIIAHLRGGPFDGIEYVLYRGRRFCTPRVRRGPLRRALNLAPRYAWYELGRTWQEDDVLHGTFAFLEMRPEPEPFYRAA